MQVRTTEGQSSRCAVIPSVCFDILAGDEIERAFAVSCRVRRTLRVRDGKCMNVLWTGSAEPYLANCRRPYILLARGGSHYNSQRSDSCLQRFQTNVGVVIDPMDHRPRVRKSEPMTSRATELARLRRKAARNFSKLGMKIRNGSEPDLVTNSNPDVAFPFRHVREGETAYESG